MKYLVTVTRLDFTHVPPARTVVHEVTMDMDVISMGRLKSDARRIFMAHSDGNDEGYVLKAVPLNDMEHWSEAQFRDFLTKFVEEEDVVLD